MVGRSGDGDGNFLALTSIFAQYYLVSYRHLVVGILAGIFGTVNIWHELSFDNLAGTPFLANLVGMPLLTWDLIGTYR